MEQQNKNLYDVSIFGSVDKNGNINELWGREALSNALKYWLTSAKGDFIRNPTIGGGLYQHLSKPMTEDRATFIQDGIAIGLREDFGQYLQILAINVTPYYTEKYWKIHLKVWSPLIKDEAEVDVRIKNYV